MRADPSSTALCPARGLSQTSGDEHQSWGLCSFLSDSAPGLSLESLSSKDGCTGLSGALLRVLPGPREVKQLSCPEGSLQTSSNPKAEVGEQVVQDIWLGVPGQGGAAQPPCPARDSVGTGVRGFQHSQRAGGDGSTAAAAAAAEVLHKPPLPPQPAIRVTRTLPGSIYVEVVAKFSTGVLVREISGR